MKTIANYFLKEHFTQTAIILALIGVIGGNFLAIYLSENFGIQYALVLLVLVVIVFILVMAKLNKAK